MGPWDDDDDNDDDGPSLTPRLNQPPNQPFLSFVVCRARAAIFILLACDVASTDLMVDCDVL